MIKIIKKILSLFNNIFIIKPNIESKKLLIHDSLVRPVVEPRSNQWGHKYIFYILLKSKYLKYITKN